MKIPVFNLSLDDLETFLSEYSMAPILSIASHNRQLRSVYRRYHAVLLWHAYLTQSRPRHFSKGEFATFFPYLEEFVSDFCQAMFLWSHGLYKPAYLVMRSSVENFVRCIGLYERQAIFDLTSTYELFELVKNTAIVNASSVARAEFSRLRQQYSQLCKYVHTADAHHMALTTAVGTFPRFDESQAKVAAGHFQALAKAAAAFLCFMFPDVLQKFHHGDKDHLLAILRVEVRRKLSSYSG